MSVQRDCSLQHSIYLDSTLGTNTLPQLTRPSVQATDQVATGPASFGLFRTCVVSDLQPIAPSPAVRVTEPTTVRAHHGPSPPRPEAGTGGGSGEAPWFVEVGRVIHPRGLNVPFP